MLLVYILFAGDKYTFPLRSGTKQEVSAHRYTLEALQPGQLVKKNERHADWKRSGK